MNVDSIVRIQVTTFYLKIAIIDFDSQHKQTSLKKLTFLILQQCVYYEVVKEFKIVILTNSVVRNDASMRLQL